MVLGVPVLPPHQEPWDPRSPSRFGLCHDGDTLGGRERGGRQSWGPGAGFGTDISAEGQREPLDPKISPHRGGKASAKLPAQGGGTQVALAAVLDVNWLLID